MTLEQLDDVLEKVKRAGAAWHKVISFTHDGEPFLHPRFSEFVLHAAKHGFRSRFSSNGSKLTADRIDQLAATGARFQICIDFSGSREIFERFRSKRGDWETVRNNISYLIHKSNEHANVNVILTEIASYSHPADAQHYLALMKSMLPVPTSRRVKFHIRNFHNAAGLVQLKFPTRTGSRYRRCPYPWVAMSIAWNGVVHACPRDLRGQTRLGNLFEVDNLTELWNGEAYREFRRRHASRELDGIAACSSCDLPWSEDKQRWSMRHVYSRLRDR